MTPLPDVGILVTGGRVKNEAVAAALREAARQLAQEECAPNIYSALDAATAPHVFFGMWCRLLNPRTHDNCYMLEFANNNERIMLLLLLAEMLERGDL